MDPVRVPVSLADCTRSRSAGTGNCAAATRRDTCSIPLQPRGSKRLATASLPQPRTVRSLEMRRLQRIAYWGPMPILKDCGTSNDVRRKLQKQPGGEAHPHLHLHN